MTFEKTGSLVIGVFAVVWFLVSLWQSFNGDPQGSYDSFVLGLLHSILARQTGE